MFRQRLICAALATVCAFAAVLAWSEESPPEGTPDSKTIDQLQQQIDLLSKQVAILQEQLDRLQADQEVSARVAEIERIRQAARAHLSDETGSSTEVDTSTDYVSGTRMQSQLNPEISVTGDLWLVGGEHIREQLLSQHFELDARSYLDPFSFMHVVLGFGGDHGHDEYGEEHEDEHEDHGVEVEEGYISWLNLPGNLSLTLGKKRQQFGVLNRWHAHSLDQADMPWVLEENFGDHGLSGTGVSVEWLMPSLWADVNDLTVEITNGDNETAFAGSDWKDPTMLARLKSYWDLGLDAYLELGVNALHGSADHDGRLDHDYLALDLTYNWNPSDRQMYRDLTLRGMAMVSDRELADRQSHEAFGGYVYGQFKFSRSWIAGIRYDWVEDQFEEGHDYWGLSPYLTFWQSEFVRLRAQMSYRDDNIYGKDRRFMLQTTFSAGPHKHETY